MTNAKKLLTNTLLLTATAFLMKTVDVSFNVYLSNRIGADGIGLFQLITAVYGMAITFSVAGIRLAAMRLVADNIALGKYNDRDGIVIDIRWNGGGRLHEDLEVFFTGQKYLTQVIRGVEACDMPSRRWNKPSIMVMSEACYSNAHGSPWVYKHQGIGKLVGAPVPGTMTSVNWVTMQDPTLIFGIPVIGYRTAEGTYLENSQLEPDIKVLNTPETIVKGEDTQLRTAVETLLRDLPAKK